MAEVLDIEIAKSVDIVHVGDEFLLYVTIRNKFSHPLEKINISYDLPKGFFIRKKDEQPQGGGQRGWARHLRDAVADYLYMSTVPVTVFGSKRSMSWNTNVLPGETYTIPIPVRAGALLPPSLKPDTYHLVFDVEYTYDGNEHSHQAKTDLIVYPHIGSIYIGAVLGGVIGAFLLKPAFTELSFLQLFVGSLAGLVLAIVFRRKTNVQSFIAVEDFWGGFLIGIMAGYGGRDLLGKFLVPGAPGVG